MCQVNSVLHGAPDGITGLFCSLQHEIRLSRHCTVEVHCIHIKSIEWKYIKPQRWNLTLVFQSFYFVLKLAFVDLSTSVASIMLSHTHKLSGLVPWSCYIEDPVCQFPPVSGGLHSESRNPNLGPEMCKSI